MAMLKFVLFVSFASVLFAMDFLFGRFGLGPLDGFFVKLLLTWVFLALLFRYRHRMLLLCVVAVAFSLPISWYSWQWGGYQRGVRSRMERHLKMNAEELRDGQPIPLNLAVDLFNGLYRPKPSAKFSDASSNRLEIIYSRQALFTGPSGLRFDVYGSSNSFAEGGGFVVYSNVRLRH